MKLDFDAMEETAIPRFRDGEKTTYARMFVDGNNRIMRGRLEPGASIGLHPHQGSSEIVYVLSGTGKALYDGGEEALAPGGCHYCPEGHTHSLVNDGGEDLIFPHHENEIAQSEAANGKEFARYWMHNGFLNIDNRKMSKSLGNFFTVREISEKYDLQVLRFFMLSAHYRSPLNFSAELMEAAKNGLERILTAAENLRFLSGNAGKGGMTEEEKVLFAKTEEYVTDFERAMDDDFNTADAIAAVFDLVKYINTTADGSRSEEYLDSLYARLHTLTDVLGIIIDKEEEML